MAQPAVQTKEQDVTPITPQDARKIPGLATMVWLQVKTAFGSMVEELLDIKDELQTLSIRFDALQKDVHYLKEIHKDGSRIYNPGHAKHPVSRD